MKSQHEAFREASLGWHQLLGFHAEKRQSQSTSKEVHDEVRIRLNRWRAMRKMNYL